LHDATRIQLEHFIARPTHALLLAGPSGVGKTAIAESLATAIVGAPIASHPYHLTIRPDGASISIEAIRNLQKFLQLKTVGTRPIRRTIIIEYAHTMTTEAQNAFLKLLEEPPADTVIILTAASQRALLPTILSRAQTIAVNVPDEAQLQPMLAASGKDANTSSQAFFLSGGLPGLLHALLHEQEHPLLASVAQAKELLQKDTFERLAMADVLSKQKESAAGVVEALERIAQAGLAGAGNKQDAVRIKQWHKVRKAALQARNALRNSANAKLVLDNLLLQLP
jgi:replication-associated recombination protein RarA